MGILFHWVTMMIQPGGYYPMPRQHAGEVTKVMAAMLALQQMRVNFEPAQAYPSKLTSSIASDISMLARRIAAAVSGTSFSSACSKRCVCMAVLFASWKSVKTDSGPRHQSCCVLHTSRKNERSAPAKQVLLPQGRRWQPCQAADTLQRLSRELDAPLLPRWGKPLAEVTVVCVISDSRKAWDNVCFV